MGTYAGPGSDGSVLIDFGQGAVSCLSAGFFEPLPGDSVRCLQVGPSTVMIGPARPRSAIGTITATGTPLLTVDVAGESFQLPYLLSFTPRNNGDIVLIDWSSGGVVVGEVSAAPAGSYDPGGSTPGTYTADFLASDSGSYQSGSWWTNQVWCSDSNIGAWFYGTAIADTIPDAATITRVQLYVPEFYNGFPGSLATVGLHGLSSKAGAPGISSAVTISDGSGMKDLPASFGDALKTGSSYGVGTNHGGYHKYYGRFEDALSGLLRIDWTV